SASALDYGPVYIGASSSRTLRISNPGTDTLVVTSVASNDPEFGPDATAFTLAPGASRDIQVRFAPAVSGEISGALTIESNDPDEPALTVSLGGVGLVPPEIFVSPSSFSESLYTGQASTRTLLIQNMAGSDLSFHLSL